MKKTKKISYKEMIGSHQLEEFSKREEEDSKYKQCPDPTCKRVLLKDIHFGKNKKCNYCRGEPREKVKTKWTNKNYTIFS